MPDLSSITQDFGLYGERECIIIRFEGFLCDIVLFCKRMMGWEGDMKTQRLRFRVTSLGFCFFLVLNAFTLWTALALPAGTFIGENAQTYWNPACLFGSIVSFFIFTSGVLKFPSLFNKMPFIPALALLVTGFAMLLTTAVIPDVYMLVGAGLFVGAGSTCCFMCWERVFAAGELLVAKKEILLASALSVIPYLVIMALPRELFVYALVFIIVPLSLALLYVATRKVPHDRNIDSDPRANMQRYKTAFKGLWAPLLCIAMIGFITPAVSAVAFQTQITSQVQTVILQGGNLASVVVLALWWLVLNKRVTITGTYLVVFPVMATALLLFPFLPSESRYVFLFLGNMGFCMMSIVMMISCMVTAQKKQLSIIIVYGLFASVTYFSGVPGYLLGTVVSESYLVSEVQIITVLFLLLYGVSVVAFFVMRNNNRKMKEEGGTVEPGIQGIDVLSKRCSAVTLEYGLSKRGSEILELLAHGRDVPAIAKILFISENTVRTHTKKIYSALSVHTRQELLDLIERSS